MSELFMCYTVSEVIHMNNSNDIANFCRNIYKLRIANNLTQTQFAATLNIDANTIQQLESGSLPDAVTAETLMLIHQQFKITPNQMFSSWDVD